MRFTLAAALPPPGIPQIRLAMRGQDLGDSAHGKVRGGRTGLIEAVTPYNGDCHVLGGVGHEAPEGDGCLRGLCSNTPPRHGAAQSQVCLAGTEADEPPPESS